MDSNSQIGPSGASLPHSRENLSERFFAERFDDNVGR